MSLLAGLLESSPVDGEPPWETFRRAMPLLVPGFELTKMNTYSGGRVAVRAKSPMQGKGKYYLVLTLDGVSAGRADGMREVRLGIAPYRDEADARLYDNPFGAWLDPQPGMVATWLAGVLLTEDVHSKRRGT